MIIGPDEIAAAGQLFACWGLDGVTWVSLMGPQPRLHTEPPWALRGGLENLALLDVGLEPKGWVEPWLAEARSDAGREDNEAFIDLSVEEYLRDPANHP
jgi:hypothetical protein